MHSVLYVIERPSREREGKNYTIPIISFSGQQTPGGKRTTHVRLFHFPCNVTVTASLQTLRVVGSQPFLKNKREKSSNVSG